MATVLVTGMSGVGKSTLLAELAARGRHVVDLDEAGVGADVPAPDGRGVEHLWDEARLSALLAAAGAPEVVAGCATNQGRFYDRLAAVVLLAVPREVLLDRLATRRTNRFGRAPDERGRVLRDLAEVEPLLRATCTVELDGTEPVGRLADAVEALLGP